MSAATARLHQAIALKGAVDIAEFMTIALSESGSGYYTTRDPLGAAGDFITAPEISQMFGEMIGLWLVDSWRRLGAPDPFVLAELGPGRGILMADALRAARVAPDFLQAMRLHLVEINPHLRRAQAEILAPHRPIWHDDISGLPEGPLLLIANEFFDALPIHQFVMTEAGWRERVVILKDGDFAYALAAPGPALHLITPEREKAARPGDMAEVSPACTGLMAWIGARMTRAQGAGLVIDYGPAASGLGDSLQAVRQHRYHDPLRDIGMADLTAHVDFAALARAAQSAGAYVFGPTTQSSFLRGLGIELRAERLCAQRSAQERALIAKALERLIAPEEMGTLFKVLSVASPALGAIAGLPL